ncbi:benzoate 4-monooxygenase cytochrome P450 [Hypoxylon trugodes]|uniref:benzoate 4-monooxygenase cytochrome P450 n=1 Tax=Hypoxylon trugodes TaxID=326681 RepID=UPI002191FC28|nr:benzoate 4-monooxygenase cytochrome P450 [Hypoxylon trugodes]KAI1389365.1 benzoate 4-monooxygenase cytochrome P450 [Hypoxylon trugodes]
MDDIYILDKPDPYSVIGLCFLQARCFYQPPVAGQGHSRLCGCYLVQLLDVSRKLPRLPWPISYIFYSLSTIARMAPVALVFVIFTLVTCLQLLRTRYQKHLTSIPGPLIASFSNLWKLAAIYDEDMPGWNKNAHKKYGPVVRIGPSHVSFASPRAFHIIHASRQAFAKSDFYEVGAPAYGGEPLENLFSLRDAQRHATLKRNIGGLYTKTAVRDFEPHIDSCIDLFMKQLAERTRDGPTELNMSVWLHLFAYECLSEINVSKKLGFLEQGKDVNGTIESSDKIFYMVGLFTQAPILQSVLNFLRSLAPAEEAEPILKFTLSEVDERRKSTQIHTDMLGKLLDLHLSNPEKLSIRELTAAIFINLTAGHDVLAITIRAIWYYLASNQHVLSKLRDEIESIDGEHLTSPMIPFTVISKLPYLNAVIQETLRVHPNTGTIIERKAPQEGATIDGYYIPGGTTVGVNAWVLHHDQTIFGKDADEFRPERWLEASEEKRLEMNQCLFSFGAGTHTCIGKNIAIMMISKLVVEFYRLYDAGLANPQRGWNVHGSWVTKQTEMDMIISRIW